MIAVIQRCKKAAVLVDGKIVGQIDQGLLVLLGVFHEDDHADADFLLSKMMHLRIFNDDAGKMNRSLIDVEGSLLIVSQFTLCGDWRKGRRPSFINAAKPDKGEALYNYFVQQSKDRSIPTATGKFGAMMDVQLTNNGPVTFVLDSRLK